MQIQLPEVFFDGVHFPNFFTRRALIGPRAAPDSLHGETSDWSTYLIAFLQGAQTGPPEKLIETLMVHFLAGSDWFTFL